MVTATLTKTASEYQIENVSDCTIFLPTGCIAMLHIYIHECRRSPGR